MTKIHGYIILNNYTDPFKQCEYRLYESRHEAVDEAVGFIAAALIREREHCGEDIPHPQAIWERYRKTLNDEGIAFVKELRYSGNCTNGNWFAVKEVVS
jgi:hypothetical protein